MSGAASFNHASKLGSRPLMPLTLKVAIRTDGLSGPYFERRQDNRLARGGIDSYWFHQARVVFFTLPTRGLTSQYTCHRKGRGPAGISAAPRRPVPRRAIAAMLRAQAPRASGYAAA